VEIFFAFANFREIKKIGTNSLAAASAGERPKYLMNLN
jgi:hypothetical protein